MCDSIYWELNGGYNYICPGYAPNFWPNTHEWNFRSVRKYSQVPILRMHAVGQIWIPPAISAHQTVYSLVLLMSPHHIMNSSQPPDVNIEVSSHKFHCHKSILISHSTYLENLFSGFCQETNNDIISLPSDYVNVESFSKLFNAMYGQHLQINGDTTLPVFVTCSYLHLTTLTEKCSKYIAANSNAISLQKLILLPQMKEYPSLYAIQYWSMYAEIFPLS